jgi:hypothetical protein
VSKSFDDVHGGEAFHLAGTFQFVHETGRRPFAQGPQRLLVGGREVDEPGYKGGEGAEIIAARPDPGRLGPARFACGEPAEVVASVPSSDPVRRTARWRPGPAGWRPRTAGTPRPADPQLAETPAVDQASVLCRRRPSCRCRSSINSRLAMSVPPGGTLSNRLRRACPPTSSQDLRSSEKDGPVRTCLKNLPT